MIKVIKMIISLASHLDNKGLTKEADILDKAAIKIAHELSKAEVGCEEGVGDELYYLENLSDMYEDMEHEDDPRDLVDT